MKKIILSILVLFMASNLFAIKITAVRTIIAEEGFQMYIVVEALKQLGYEVEVTNPVDYVVAYKIIAQNKKDMYFMAANWDPVQKNMLNSIGRENLFIGGKYIENCAQGYMIDKKTADKYNIKYLNDLKDPKIAKLFDMTGNGKADLAGCAPGWACGAVMDYQLDAFGLSDNITQNQGEYSAMISNKIARYNSGKPILYYAWTPYWVSGKLVPGKDTVFLQVTHSAHPSLKSTKLSNGDDYGFAINTQRIVANALTKNHKDIAKLFEIMKLNVNDVSGENLLMAKGENKEKDIVRHAKMWVKQNQAILDTWIKEAKAAK